MTRREVTSRRPLEETPEVAEAVDDETTVPQLETDGGTGPASPDFTGPDDVPGDFPPTDEVIGDPLVEGAPGGAIRTGAEQPWDPGDLAVAQGRDPTPASVDRARQELSQDGPAAIERTVP